MYFSVILLIFLKDCCERLRACDAILLNKNYMIKWGTYSGLTYSAETSYYA